MEHLLQAYDVGDQFDEIASAEPSAAAELEELATRLSPGVPR